jgi:Ca2+-binding EF-hand superfamily protein
VSVRQKEEELLFTIYKAIQSSGLSLKGAFEAFDTNGDRVISKKDMKEVMKELDIVVSNDAIDYIFKIADSSGDD